MTMSRREAGQHLRAMMEASYEGRSVRTPHEFRRDLQALRIAADVLDPLPDAVTHRCTGDVEDNGPSMPWGTRKPCPGRRTADGRFHDECGEPCRWRMMKSGEGTPPWTEADAEALS